MCAMCACVLELYSSEYSVHFEPVALVVVYVCYVCYYVLELCSYARVVVVAF